MPAKLGYNGTLNRFGCGQCSFGRRVRGVPVPTQHAFTRWARPAGPHDRLAQTPGRSPLDSDIVLADLGTKDSRDAMNENSDLLPNLLHEEFEMQMRGYSRRQVDDFVARRNSEIRDLEQRLARTLDEAEHLRREVATVRQQALAGRPAHEEVSERMMQILKLADDEAKAQKGKADDEIARLRGEAQQESERVRADAREQAERMLTAAQEQAERTISAARNEADKTRTAARTEADRLTSETRKKADAALANAKGQAKKVLDEATARATAIHDGAERRLNLLSTRHTETVRRLTDILNGVQGLVAAEAARMSLEEEVNQHVSKAIALAEAQEQEQAAAAAAAAPREEAPSAPRPADRPADLGSLAPPAPETVANGTPAPARNGMDSRPSQPGRQPGSRPGQGLPDSAPLGGQALPAATPPGLGNARSGTAADGPGLPLPSGASRSSSGLSGGPLSGNPLSGGPLASGPPPRPSTLPSGTLPSGPARGDSLAPDRDRDRDPLRDAARTTGAIDPDEPTEGIRLMP
jgi:cell division septum initiation protein DivIVA